MASPPSAGATLHPSFGAIGEACQAAIAARSTVLRRTHPRWLLRASVARWDGIHQVLPTRGDCLRKELSSGKCRRHAPFPVARYAQGAWTRVASWPPASPTSAVRGGQGRSFGHLEKKSPLHFGGSGDRRRHAQALREVEAEPVEEGSLGGVRAHHAAQAQLAAVLGRQDDVCALNTPEFIEDRARTPAEARASLPLLERLPQHVGEETDEDVGLRSEEHTSELQSLAYL